MTESVINIPDLGGVETATIIELSVKVGDIVKPNDTIMVLESEKASMEIPINEAGEVQTILVAVGDKVSTGMPVMTLVHNDHHQSEVSAQSTTVESPTPEKKTTTPAVVSPPTKITEQTQKIAPVGHYATTHAGPAVRKLAREFGIDLFLVKPSGPRQRILKEDLQLYVKQIIAGGAAPSHFDVPSMPDVDFAEFGEIEPIDIGRIKKLTAINMHRNWVRIPHVTQFDEADITELEVFRKSSTIIEKSKMLDVKLTALPFIIKAAAFALKKFPQFNASIQTDGQKLILKKYCHIGFAVDTDDGLFVPVIRDADKKTIWELAQSAKALSEKARTKKLLPNEMKGGCFTISSLGSVGGTAFTPIINAPEVAILGVSRAAIKPVYINGHFEPRTLLPLSLSYDHRIIDGAEAARFTAFMASILSDVNQLTTG